MTRILASLSEVGAGYDAIVFDQWGVLHDGSAPYPSAVATLETLKADGHRLAVLTNSGRRAAANTARLSALGFAPDLFDCVMSSGEALWRVFAAGEMPCTRVHAIARSPGDAAAWAEGLDLAFTPVETAEAVLLMGIADSAGAGAHAEVFAAALERGLPLLCSNPDKTAPRAGGATVVMPGTLAQSYADNGGAVQYFGKPYTRVFCAVEAALGLSQQKILMVGDSLEHDIAGAGAAGWDSAFISGGLHAAAFDAGAPEDTVAALAGALATPRPDYMLDTLR